MRARVLFGTTVDRIGIGGVRIVALVLGVGALLLDLSIYGLVYGEVAGFLGFGVALLCPPGRSRAIAIAVNVGAIALAAVLWLVFATVG